MLEGSTLYFENRALRSWINRKGAQQWRIFKTQIFNEGHPSNVKKHLGEWSDELYVIVLYPDPRAERLQRRLEQLQRLDDWLQQLTRWEQWLLPVPFALFTGWLGVWLNSLLPPIDPNQLGLQFWLGP